MYSVGVDVSEDPAPRGRSSPSSPGLAPPAGPFDPLSAETIVLPSAILPATLDSVLTSDSQSSFATSETLLLDLTYTEYIDLSALLQLCALLRQRARTSLTTLLRLPRHQRVRDFLRTWRFEAGVQAATGRTLYSQVTEDSKHYFGEAQIYYLGRKRKTDTTGEEFQVLLSNRFWGIQAYALDAMDRPRDAVDQEWARWRSSLVQSVLRRHLHAQGDNAAEELVRVVLFELISNAIEHPRARLMLTTSRAVNIEAQAGHTSKGERIDRSLSIGVWDDGIPFTETLRSALTAGQPIRTTAETQDDTFRIKASGWTSESPVLSSSYTPSLQDPDEVLVLASLFSGISCRAALHTPTQTVGNGLFALYRAVIDSMGGSLLLRTGRVYLSLKRDSSRYASRYAAKVRRIGGTPFPGNLIMVRMPLT